MLGINKIISKQKTIFSLANAMSKQHTMIPFASILIFSEIQTIFMLLEMLFTQIQVQQNFIKYIDEAIINVAKSINLRSDSICNIFLSNIIISWLLLLVIAVYLIMPFLTFYISQYKARTVYRFVGFWLGLFKMSHPCLISFLINSWLIKIINYVFDNNEYDIQYIIIGIISILLTIMNFSVSIFLYISFAPMLKGHDLSGMKNCTNRLISIWFKTISIIIMIIPNDYFKLGFSVGISLIWTLSRDYFMFKDMPLFSIKLGKILTVFHGIATGIASMNVIYLFCSVLEVYMTIAYAEIMLILCGLLVILYLNFMNYRLELCLKKINGLSESMLITKIILVENSLGCYHQKEFKLKNIQQDELKLHGFVKDHILNCPECVSDISQTNSFNQYPFEKLRIHIIEKLLDDGIAQYPSSFVLVCMLVNFWLDEKLNPSKALFIIHILKNSKRQFKEQLVLHALFKKIQTLIEQEDSQNSSKRKLNLINFRDNEILFDKFCRLIEKDLGKHLQFWDELNVAIPNFSLMINTAIKSRNTFRKLKQFWLRYQSLLQPTFFKPYLIYGIFLTFVKNEVENGKNYFDKFNNLILKYEDMLYHNKLDNNTLFCDKVTSILFKRNKENIGTIVSCNDSIEDILKYDARSLIGNDIAILLPNSFKIKIKNALKKYFETGKSWLINTIQDFFLLDHHRCLIHVELNMKEFPYFQDEMLFMINFTEKKNGFEYMLTLENGQIEEYTRGIDIDPNLAILKSKKNLLHECIRLPDNTLSLNKLISQDQITPKNAYSRKKIAFKPTYNEIETTTVQDYSNFHIIEIFSSNADKFRKFAEILEDQETTAYLKKSINHNNNNSIVIDRIINKNHVLNSELEIKIECMIKKYDEEFCVRIFKIKKKYKKTPKFISSQTHFEKHSNHTITTENLILKPTNEMDESSFLCDRMKELNKQLYHKINNSKQVKRAKNLKSARYSEFVTIPQSGEYSFEALPNRSNYYNTNQFIQNNLFHHFKSKDINQTVEEREPFEIIQTIEHKPASELIHFKQIQISENYGHNSENNFESGYSNTARAFIKNNMVNLKGQNDSISRPYLTNSIIKLEKVNKYLKDKRYNAIKNFFTKDNEYNIFKIILWLGTIMIIANLLYLILLYIWEKDKISKLDVILRLYLASESRLINLIEIQTRSSVLWLLNQNLFIINNQSMLNSLNSSNLIELNNKSYDLLSNTILILSELHNIDTKYVKEIFNENVKYYEYDNNLARIDNEYITFNTFESANHLFNHVVNAIIKLKNEKNEELTNILGNTINDMLNNYVNIANIFIKQSKDLTSPSLMITYSILLFNIVFGFIILMLLSICLITIFNRKKAALISILGLNIVLCEEYSNLLRHILIAIKDKWSIKKLLIIINSHDEDHIDQAQLKNSYLNTNTSNNGSNKIINHHNDNKKINTLGIKIKLIMLISLMLLFFIIILSITIIRLKFLENYNKTKDSKINKIALTNLKLYESSLSIAAFYNYIGRNGTALIKNQESGLILNQTLRNIYDIYNLLEIFQDDINQLNHDIENILYHNACTSNIYNVNNQNLCLTIQGGIASTNGIIGLNSFIYQIIHNAINIFDTSERSIQDIKNALNSKNIQDLPQFFFEIIQPGYNYINQILFNQIRNINGIYLTNILILLIIGIFSIIVINTFIMINLSENLRNERKALEEIINIIPKPILIKSKFNVSLSRLNICYCQSFNILFIILLYEYIN